MLRRPLAALERHQPSLAPAAPPVRQLAWAAPQVRRRGAARLRVQAWALSLRLQQLPAARGHQALPARLRRPARQGVICPARAAQQQVQQARLRPAAALPPAALRRADLLLLWSSENCIKKSGRNAAAFLFP